MTFRVGGAAFALPADAVEVLPPARPTPVPRARGGCDALVDVHGRHVPVLNLERALGRPGARPGSPVALLLVATRPEAIALVVDGVEPPRPWEPATVDTTLLDLPGLLRAAAAPAGCEGDDASQTLEV